MAVTVTVTSRFRNRDYFQGAELPPYSYSTSPGSLPVPPATQALTKAITSADLTGGPDYVYVWNHNKRTETLFPSVWNNKGQLMPGIVVRKDMTSSTTKKNTLIFEFNFLIPGTWELKLKYDLE